MRRFAVGASGGFRDRREAGRQLAAALSHLRHERPVVLGLPRGGVAVAGEVADALDAPLDVALVRKLGVPYQPELAVGAIGEGGVRVVNAEVRRAAGVNEQDLRAVEARERSELDRQAGAFRGGLPPVDLLDRTVVIVDDGIATGSTALAACRIARARGATKVVLATPVAPRATLRLLNDAADEIVCLRSPEPFFAIGQWYVDFSQTTDEEVVALLRARRTRPDPEGAPGVTAQNTTGEAVEVVVAPDLALPGVLTVPPAACAAVVFAHGSGSSRSSPRNRVVSARLWEVGLGTLLFDLLDDEEGSDRALVFDVELLGMRLAAAARWLDARTEVSGLPVGVFGASTGSAAALWAASDTESPIRAVVSRGGRPDLVEERLGRVRCPTLLVVGSLDTVVLELNERALAAMPGIAQLEVVPGAGHLFEEPGALDAVARRAGAFFLEHLPAHGGPA